MPRIRPSSLGHRRHAGHEPPSGSATGSIPVDVFALDLHLLAAVSLILTLDTTPLHQLAYLIPRYQALHEHDPWRVVALASIGPAMLGGAGIEMVARLHGRYRLLPIAVVPLVATAGRMIAVGDIDRITQ